MQQALRLFPTAESVAYAQAGTRTLHTTALGAPARETAAAGSSSCSSATRRSPPSLSRRSTRAARDSATQLSNRRKSIGVRTPLLAAQLATSLWSRRLAAHRVSLPPLAAVSICQESTPPAAQKSSFGTSLATPAKSPPIARQAPNEKQTARTLSPVFTTAPAPFSPPHWSLLAASETASILPAGHSYGVSAPARRRLCAICRIAFPTGSALSALPLLIADVEAASLRCDAEDCCQQSPP